MLRSGSCLSLWERWPCTSNAGEGEPVNKDVYKRQALAHAKDYGNDIVILDTAGRLQDVYKRQV